MPALSATWRRLRTALTPRPTYVYMGGYGVGVTWRGDRILLPGGDIGLPPYIATRGRWEPALERLLDRLVRPGDTVVDAGANVGYHTLGLGHAVGPRGRVHALEANPRLVRLVARSVEMAGFNGRTSLHAAAVADRAGAARFSVDPEWSAGGHLGWEGAAAEASETMQVPTVRLDDLLADTPRLQLLRMDVEGSEALALAGAREVIARSPSLRIVTEWDVAAMRVRSDVSAAVAALTDEGFRARVVEPRGGLTPVAMADLPALDRGRTVNLLLSRD